MTSDNANNRGAIVVHVHAKTDVGRTREHNEDAFLVADLNALRVTPILTAHDPGERGTLLMVADGMGGAAAGEVASAIATETVLSELDTRWRAAAGTDPETFAVAIKTATEAANSKIHRYAAEHPENRGMGTTATIAGLLGDQLYLAQVGDSRGYIVRGGVAQQITKDQSLMQKLVEAGELTAEEAEVSERRNIILQALGPEPAVRVDLTNQQIRRGDVLVLCSDGLSGQMRSSDIARIVGETAPDLSATASKLIDLANENGGPDNITVVVARFEGEGLSVAESSEEVGHRVYTGENEARATMPVSASSIPTLTEEEERAFTSAPTMERPSNPSANKGATPNAAPTVRAAPAAAPAAAAPRPGAAATAADSKIPVVVLRVLFGAIALGIIGWILMFKFSGK